MAYVLAGRQFDNHGTVDILDTIPVATSGWTDLAEIRLAGQRWLGRQRTRQDAKGAPRLMAGVG
ncbi:MAG: hypothetical protein ACRDTC_15405 [Pseudonocardiaceae bacterium]